MLTTKAPTPSDFLLTQLNDFEQYQSDYLDSLIAADPLLLDAIKYVLNTPGKKFRAMMVYACGQLFTIPSASLHPLALAIELIHTYSLVHDDLPAMDNDDFRRGKPSCHKAFDEATAILTGNALHHLAFAHLIEKLSPDMVSIVCKIILDKIGIQGILSGQNLDLKALKKTDIELATLEQIHYLKTTTLLEAIALSVAEIASASTVDKDALTQFCKHLGLAYQMLDDYGDYYATASWGKGKASDLNNKKFTFVQFYDKEHLENAILEEVTLAKESLFHFKHQEVLLELTEQISQRLNLIR